MNAPYLQKVCERLFVGCGGEMMKTMQGCYHFFTTPEIVYHAYCDDFGPMCASSIIEFIKCLDAQIRKHPDLDIVYIVDSDVRTFTNAVFLIGSYLILKKNMHPSDVWNIFNEVPPEMFEGYRDATFSERKFRLSLLDCWLGLFRAKSFGWIGMPNLLGRWGSINQQEYDHYAHPLDAGLTIVVPGKFVALKGPRDIDTKRYKDTVDMGRLFSPEYFVDIFKVLGVTDVVQLNKSAYKPDPFLAAGMRHHDLCFNDCTPPPSAIVKQFFDLVRQTPGVVAVHCKAGLGRTGTLIALYLMSDYSFTAREAMGWLRIMRPGCVIGEQQDFLCTVERLARSQQHPHPPPFAPHAADADAGLPPSPAAAAARRRHALAGASPAAAAAAFSRLPPLPSATSPAKGPGQRGDWSPSTPPAARSRDDIGPRTPPGSEGGLPRAGARCAAECDALDIGRALGRHRAPA